MITIESAQLVALFASGWWPFGRALGLVLAISLFSGVPVARWIQLAIAVALTLILAPLSSTPDIAPFGAIGTLMFLQQVIIGALIGFAVRLTFAAVEFAAYLIGIETGFELAQLYDFTEAPQAPMLRQLMTWVALLIFLAIDGHLYVVSILAQSLQYLPIGTSFPLEPAVNVAKSASLLFGYGLLLALPVIAALLLAQLAFAFVGRASVQFDTLSYALPLSLLLGVVVLAAMLPVVGAALEVLLETNLRSLATLFAASRAQSGF